jgi:hypothetical protein
MRKFTSKSWVLACLDGALHIWQTSSNFVRPNMTIEGAHAKSTETGSLVFSVDGRTVLTRGGDDTVKCTSLTISCFTCLLQQFEQYGIYDLSRNRWLRGRKLRHSTPIPTPSSVRMTNSFSLEQVHQPKTAREHFCSWKRTTSKLSRHWLLTQRQ